jgi:LysM repeat protein
MGSPTQENRIYIENAAYARVHEEDYAKQRAFIFMGHTECKEGCYATYVEAAIPVRDLEFSQNVPSWNTHVWSDVFREVKRSYENSIIVGWALDCRGFAPRMTAALEAVHREQFGGAHQVLLLMDTLEGEEYFFQNHGSRLQKKEGFYIYYARELHRICPADVTVEIPSRESVQTIPEKKQDGNDKVHTSYAMVAAVAALVVILGLGLVQGQIPLQRIGQAVQAMGKRVKNGIGSAEWLVGTENVEGTEVGTEAAETIELIPIEEVPAGEITKLEDISGQDSESQDAGGENSEQTQSQQSDSESSQSQTVAADVTQEADSESSRQDTATADSEQVTASSAQMQTYIVKKGDTLTDISQRLYGTDNMVKEIAELNNLENSDNIHVGQKLLLP